MSTNGSGKPTTFIIDDREVEPHHEPKPGLVSQRGKQRSDVAHPSRTNGVNRRHGA